MTNAVLQLETLYHKPIDQINENEIITALKAWDDEDNFIPIIELVDALPHAQQTPQILSEQARACNNVYWLNKIPENIPYLERALSIFQSLEKDLGNEQDWNYKIGYSYFYLNDKQNAKKHLTISKDYNNEEDLLSWIERAEEKNISTLDAENGGLGTVEYDLEDFFALLEKKAPKIANSFNQLASKTELRVFEKKLGIVLPESFEQLYRTFNGQKFGAKFSNLEDLHRFLTLEEIISVQDAYVDKLTNTYGESWQDIRISQEDMIYDEEIKNRLYHRLWIPFAISEDNTEDEEEFNLLCLDLDPNTEGKFGQIISISFSDDLELYLINLENWSLKEEIRSINSMLKHDYLVYDNNEKCLVIDNHEPFDDELICYPDNEEQNLKIYIEKTFGKISHTMSDMTPNKITCDIHVISPTDKTPYYTLVTSGMGAYMMSVPDEITPAYSELLIRLPADWQLDSDDERDFWPIRQLKNLACLPFYRQSYFSSGHTVSVETLAGTNFECMLLLEADDGDDIAVAKLSEDKSVIFYSLVPLYHQEMLYKLDKGNMALMQALEEAQIPYPPVVDIHRINVCENYLPNDKDLSVFDGVFWSFNHVYYLTCMQFYQALMDYNTELDNDISGFNPWEILCKEPMVYVMYQARLRSEDDLQGNEILKYPEVFLGESDGDGYYHTTVVLTIQANDDRVITAIELLHQIQNAIANKELGEHVFFEGFKRVGTVSDLSDEVPVIEVLFGS